MSYLQEPLPDSEDEGNSEISLPVSHGDDTKYFQVFYDKKIMRGKVAQM